MGELANRRAETHKRVGELQERLESASKLVEGKACVYTTGSFGRCEASPNSDLDLFIVGKRDGKIGPNGVEGSLLKRLDEICVKADLIDTTRTLGIPEFDGDGRYLVHYSVHELIKTLGTPEDDVTNTFTARLLLLLESNPLLGEAVYQEIIEEVIAAYWGDYEDHKNNFIPAFLANDILRLWRTFCVNYEARTEKQPDEKRIKRKIKNYKLKYSRMLTCYSALLYLLAIFRRTGTVTPQDAKEMIRLSPTQRLEWALDQADLAAAHDTIRELLKQYEQFLKTTSVAEAELISQFMNRDKSSQYMDEASKFGDTMFEALSSIGCDSRFYRLLMV